MVRPHSTGRLSKGSEMEEEEEEKRKGGRRGLEEEREKRGSRKKWRRDRRRVVSRARCFFVAGGVKKYVPKPAPKNMSGSLDWEEGEIGEGEKEEKKEREEEEEEEIIWASLPFY